jgi:hypothetical protein
MDLVWRTRGSETPLDPVDGMCGLVSCFLRGLPGEVGARGLT